jgi:hypothetical protein
MIWSKTTVDSHQEFYKRVMDRLLKRIQRARPIAFCSRDFFLLRDNVPTHKTASVCQFLTQNTLNPVSTPPPRYCPDLSPPDYFMFPKLKVKLKGLHFVDVAEVQETMTDELKKVQKEEFSAAFQKLYDRAKACVCTNGAYFEFKKKKNIFVFLVSSIFKKISPKTFGLQCVYCITRAKVRPYSKITVIKIYINVDIT